MMRLTIFGVVVLLMTCWKLRLWEQDERAMGRSQDRSCQDPLARAQRFHLAERCVEWRLVPRGLSWKSVAFVLGCHPPGAVLCIIILFTWDRLSWDGITILGKTSHNSRVKRSRLWKGDYMIKCNMISGCLQNWKTVLEISWSSIPMCVQRPNCTFYETSPDFVNLKRPKK